MSADFSGLAAALLTRAETLVPEWLPGGKRAGTEWVCGNLQGGKGRSTSVNLKTGFWSDFSNADLKGGDLTSLYAAQHSLSQIDAARELAKQIGYDLERAPVNGHAKSNGSHPATELAAEPAPTSAALPEPAGMLGRWAYYRAAEQGPILVVCRLPPDPDGKKQFRQYTWRGGRWSPKGLAAPRPLYRLPVLKANPDKPVLVCEGEKACQAAQAALPDWIVTTWSQGSQSVAKTDFTPLAHRRVTLWPDADEPGRKAMAQIAGVLLPTTESLAVIDTAARADGWDAADADPSEIAELVACARRVASPQKPERLGRANPMPVTGGATVARSGELFDDGSAYSQWQALGLVCNHNGQPLASLGNASLILERHPQLQGRIWLDTFRKQTWHSTAGSPARWTDIDALRLTQWVDQALKLPKISLETVSNAVALVAANHARNSVVDWLESLTWDGTARLDHWLEDCLGVAKTAFTMAVARNWLVSMVARAYRPGCQADHMPVLEGSSGAGKSSSLAILGGEWYRAAPQAFGSKEFIEVIQGAWLIEIPDMVGFGRREHTQIISAITTRSDPFRASYGRHAEDHPRTVIFAATSETDEYLQDTRGMRRYWPLVCTEIRRDILAGLRERLFAEAVVSFKAGATWHEVPKEEARTEQAQREQSDPWLEKVSDFVSGRTAVTAGEVASGIGLRAGEQTHAASIRIANCLKMLGFSQKLERAGNLVKRVYRRG